MDLRHLATVLVRLYGLSLLFRCLQYGQEFIVLKASFVRIDSILKTNLITGASISILYLVAGVCLLVFANTIAGWVTPKISERFDIIVPTADLALVSFSLVGIYFFVDGISWFAHDGVLWHLSSGSRDPLDARIPASVAMSAIKVLLGLFLIFGSRGVLRAIRWAQREGAYERSPEVNQPTIELSKIPKCPNCGAEYNPGDYRQDALEWLCSGCGMTLPKE